MRLLIKVEKRDGRIVSFNPDKITNAISKAFQSTEGKYDINEVLKLTEEVVKKLDVEDREVVNVEEIQDIVEEVLGEDHFEVSRKYILYRQERTIQREKKQKIHKIVKKIVRQTGRENANVGNSPSSKLLQIAEAEGRDFMEKELTSPRVLQAMEDNILHPHDYSWGPIGTTTCSFIPLKKLLEQGFNSGHGYIRSPKRLKTAAQLSCIILQSNQNDQHGGQAYGWYDRDLAPYVEREYRWQLVKALETLSKLEMIPKSEILIDKKIKENPEKIDVLLSTLPEEIRKKIKEMAWEYTEREAFQAMESVVFNLNTMHSRAGAQVPFTSINIGTDTSKEGRLITKCLLEAYKKGLGKGEQPIFPNIIFKVKKGVNFYPNDPNYDLLLLSMETSSLRLFPNYVFQDCSINKDFPGDIPTMGCRTRVAWNVNSDTQTCEGRGNISFTTNNLVRMALKARYDKLYSKKEGDSFEKLASKYNIRIPEKYKDICEIKVFFNLLNKYTDLAIQQLRERYKYQCTFRKSDFPFLLNGVWMDSENLGERNNLHNVWKHGTLSMGFIGLAETLKCLVGKHHGEDESADQLGEQIISFMSKKTEEATKKYSLNFSLLATPAEGLAGKFTEVDRREYGIIKGVTDKEWYTNSFHVPVEYPVSIFRKIEIEGKYHKYCNAGSISYIELGSAPINNLKAFYNILSYMLENDMSYVALNFPVDRCKDCNHQGVIEKHCPVCGSNQISRVRRITGYLAELDMFNSAKKQEVLNRIKHDSVR